MIFRQGDVAMKITTALSLGFLLGTSYLPGSMAQQINGTPGSPSATTTIDGKQLPPEPPEVRRSDQGRRQGFQALLATIRRAA
jgi:hypothetical protein